MNVAAPRWKHSWMFGQRADSQTVCRFELPQSGLQAVERFEMRAALARPFGQTRARGGRAKSVPGHRSGYSGTGGSPAFSRSVLALPIDCVSL